MKKFYALTKIQLLNFIRSFALKSGGSGKSSKIFWIVLLMPLLFLPQVIMIFGSIYDQYRALGAPEMAVGTTYLIASVFILMESFAVVLSTIIANRDIESLIVMPVKARTIMYSKFFFVYAGAAAVSLYLMAVPSVRYSMDYGWHYLPMAIFVALLAPAIPLAVNQLVIAPLTRLLMNKRNRSIVFVTVNGLFIIVLLGFSILSQRMMAGDMSASSLDDLILTMLTRAYPPTRFAVGAFMFRWLDVVIYTAMSLGFFALVGALASRLFHRVVINQTDSAPEKAKKSEVRFVAGDKKKHIYKRMFKIITGSSYLLLTAVMSMMTPVILIIMYVSTGLIPKDSLQSDLIRSFAPMVVLGVALFPALFDSLAQCAISREGKFFWESRVYPISSRDYAGYYLKFHLAIIGVQQLIMGVAAGAALKGPAPECLIALGAAWLLGISYISMSLLLDITAPNLTWTMIQQIAKNGRNQFVAILGKIAATGLLAFVFLKVLGGLPQMTVLLTALAVAAVMACVSLAIYRRYAGPALDRIEP